MRADAPLPRVLLSDPSHVTFVKKVLRTFRGLESVVSTIRDFTPAERRQKRYVEKGKFNPKTGLLRIEERQPIDQFKALFLHEVGHALLYLHLGRKSRTVRVRAISDSILPFYLEVVFPYLPSVWLESVEHSASTYISSLVSKWEDSKKDETSQTKLFGLFWNEVLCDLFALYTLTRFSGLPVDFLKKFEALLGDLDLPILQRTL